MAGLMDFLFGQKGQMMQTPTMTGGQQDFLSQLLSGLSGGNVGGGAMGAGMGNLTQLLSGSPEAFKAFEAPYMRQFQEQTIPGLAERFSKLGSGSQGSSAFGQQMGQQAAGLSEQLASLRGNLQQNSMQQLLGFGQMGLGAKPFENVYRPQSTGFLGAMAPGIGAALGGGMMGGMGSGLSALLKLFKGGSGLQPGYMSNPQYGTSWGG